MDYRFSTREKNGSVCLILSYKVGKKWRQKTKQGFRTQREARRAQDELLDAAKKEAGFAGVAADLKGITLRQFWPMYERDKKNILAPSTLWSYALTVKHFSPIADIPLTELSTAAILNVFQSLPLARRTKNLHLAALHAILEYARKVYHLIAVNPVSSIPKVKSREKEPVRALSRDQLERLLSVLKDGNSKPIYLLVLVASSTGMRRGEIMGLTWDRIDWLRQTITIDRQWLRQKDYSYAFGPLKTKNSYRTIHASTQLLHALRVWKQGRPLSIDNRVFGGLSTSYLYAAAGQIIRKMYPGMTIHSLRHTFATILLQRTGDVNLVAGVLGDTVATVSSTYLDYTQDLRDRAAAEMENIL
jgi:integrase